MLEMDNSLDGDDPGCLGMVKLYLWLLLVFVTIGAMGYAGVVLLDAIFAVFGG